MNIPRKLPARFAPIAFSFYMSAMVALMMSAVLTAVNTGGGEGFLRRVAGAYLVAWPAAFVCVMAVRPLVLRLVQLTVMPPPGR